MNVEQIIEELEQAARQLGVAVRWEKGNFRGGRCTVGADEFIMLNKRHTPEVQLAVLAESLRELPVDTVYLRPAAREALEDVWQRADSLDDAYDEAVNVE